MPDIRHAVVPDIGDSQQLPIVEILVAVGDDIELNQGLITLESDKATLEIPATFSGRITELLVKVDDLLSAGSLIATVAVEGTAIIEEKKKEPLKADRSEGDVTTSLNMSVVANEIPASNTPEATPYASPLVYRLARELKVDLQRVTGTARQGRICQDDIMQFVKSASGRQQTLSEKRDDITSNVDDSDFGETERKPLTSQQKISSASLSRNWAMIPHVTYHDEADITDLEALRILWNQEHSAAGVNIILLAFLLKVSAAGLKTFPRINAELDIDNGELILKQYRHIGFTVDTPEGTVIPVIRDVGSKSVTQLAQEIVILSRKAQEATLTSAETSGGCFTLSSVDGIGGLAFTPIINASEVAILGISTPRWRSPPFGPAEERRMILPLSLSYDNRVIDNTTAAHFVAYLKELLADIRRLLL